MDPSACDSVTHFAVQAHALCSRSHTLRFRHMPCAPGRTHRWCRVCNAYAYPDQGSSGRTKYRVLPCLQSCPGKRTGFPSPSGRRHRCSSAMIHKGRRQLSPGTVMAASSAHIHSCESSRAAAMLHPQDPFPKRQTFFLLDKILRSCPSCYKSPAGTG